MVCLITQAPIPGSDSLYSQMMVAYQQMVSCFFVPFKSKLVHGLLCLVSFIDPRFSV